MRCGLENIGIMAGIEFNAENRMAMYERIGKEINLAKLITENEPSAFDRMKAEMRRMFPPSQLTRQQLANIKEMLKTHKVENIEIVANILKGAGEVENAEDAFVTLWLNSVLIRCEFSREQVSSFFHAAAAVRKVSLADACRDQRITDNLLSFNMGELWLGKYIDAIWANVPQ